MTESTDEYCPKALNIAFGDGTVFESTQNNDWIGLDKGQYVRSAYRKGGKVRKKHQTNLLFSLIR